MYLSFWASEVITFGAPMPLNRSFSIAVAIIFPSILCIIHVTQNMQNKTLVGSEIDVRDQPALVVSDIENHASAYPIDLSPGLFYVREIIPRSRFDYSVPCV